MLRMRLVHAAQTPPRHPYAFVGNPSCVQVIINHTPSNMELLFVRIVGVTTLFKASLAHMLKVGSGLCQSPNWLGPKLLRMAPEPKPGPYAAVRFPSHFCLVLPLTLHTQSPDQVAVALNFLMRLPCNATLMLRLNLQGCAERDRLGSMTAQRVMLGMMIRAITNLMQFKTVSKCLEGRQQFEWMEPLTGCTALSMSAAHGLAVEACTASLPCRLWQTGWLSRTLSYCWRTPYVSVSHSGITPAIHSCNQLLLHICRCTMG